MNGYSYGFLRRPSKQMVRIIFSIPYRLFIEPEKMERVIRIIVKRLGLGLGLGLGTGDWDGDGELGMGNGNGKMGMRNKEYPYPQSQEMTV